MWLAPPAEDPREPVPRTAQILGGSAHFLDHPGRQAAWFVDLNADPVQSVGGRLVMLIGRKSILGMAGE